SFIASSSVTYVWSWSQTNKRRQAVAHRDTVGPKTRCTTVSVCKGMNSHPLSMDPRTQIDDGSKLVGVQFVINWKQEIELRNQILKLLFKFFQLLQDICSVNTTIRAYPYLNV